MITLRFDYIRTMCVNGFSTILTLIVSVHAGAYGMGIYAIMLPSSVFSVAHYPMDWRVGRKIGPGGELASGGGGGGAEVWHVRLTPIIGGNLLLTEKFGKTVGQWDRIDRAKIIRVNFTQFNHQLCTLRFRYNQEMGRQFVVISYSAVWAVLLGPQLSVYRPHHRDGFKWFSWNCDVKTTHEECHRRSYFDEVYFQM